MTVPGGRINRNLPACAVQPETCMKVGKKAKKNVYHRPPQFII